MRVVSCAALIGVVAMLVNTATCAGQDLCRQHHPWAEFEPGAWKQVRIFTETLDENGQVTGTSTTDMRTTLLQMDEQGITLEVATTVEVAGKRFEAEPQTLDQGYWGELETQTLRPGKVTSAQITVGEQSLPCQIQEFELIGSNTRTATKVHYSEAVRPHVLRRESVTTSLDGEQKLGETTSEVLALDLPFRVLSEIQPTAHVRSVNRHPKGTVFTLAVTSAKVPGGVVSHWSKEVDRTGRIVRRSTLELQDYGLEDGTIRTGLFGRQRPRRTLRSPNP